MTDREKLNMLLEAIDYSFWNLQTQDYDKELTYPVIDKVKYIRKLLKEEPTTSVWHDASEEPCTNDDDNHRGHCLIYYGAIGNVGYLDFELAFYNKEEKVFITEQYPHPTGYKVEQKSLDGGVVAEVYKNKRDRIPITDIAKWAYLEDLYEPCKKTPSFRVGMNCKKNTNF